MRRLLLFAAALAICALGGEGHFFYANSDWFTRDAVLADLVSHSWPVGYAAFGQDLVLRAPIGMYLVPALAGKLAGIRIAHLALLAQNAFLLSLVLSLLAAHSRSTFQRAATIIVFVLFSGLDIVSHSALALVAMARGEAQAFALPSHLERWAGIFQYSSHITQIFWVPNHALPGWAFVALYWSEARRSRFSLRPVLMVGLLPLWSPFAAMGTLPFCAHALLRKAWRGIDRADAATFAAIATLAIPAALYLLTGAGGVERGLQPFTPWFAPTYVAFVILEFGIYVLLVGRSRRSPELVLATVVLLLIPFYKINFTNDFAMRASIPALAVLALAVAEYLARPDAGLASRRLVVVTLLIGAATPASEIRAALSEPAWAPSSCDLIDAWTRGPFGKHLPSHYVADARSFSRVPFFAAPKPPLLTADAGIKCWVDDPKAR